MGCTISCCGHSGNSDARRKASQGEVHERGTIGGVTASFGTDSATHRPEDRVVEWVDSYNLLLQSGELDLRAPVVSSSSSTAAAQIPTPMSPLRTGSGHPMMALATDEGHSINGSELAQSTPFPLNYFQPHHPLQQEVLQQQQTHQTQQQPMLHSSRPHMAPYHHHAQAPPSPPPQLPSTLLEADGSAPQGKSKSHQRGVADGRPSHISSTGSVPSIDIPFPMPAGSTASNPLIPPRAPRNSSFTVVAHHPLIHLHHTHSVHSTTSHLHSTHCTTTWEEQHLQQQAPSGCVATSAPMGAVDTEVGAGVCVGGGGAGEMHPVHPPAAQATSRTAPLVTVLLSSNGATGGGAGGGGGGGSSSCSALMTLMGQSGGGVRGRNSNMDDYRHGGRTPFPCQFEGGAVSSPPPTTQQPSALVVVA